MYEDDFPIPEPEDDAQAENFTKLRILSCTGRFTPQL